MVAVFGPGLVKGTHGPGSSRGPRAAGGGSSSNGAASRGPGGAGAGVPVRPALFQAGSCVLFAPTRGDHHETVFLDAGHGGVDPGATGEDQAGRPVYEADLTLQVELRSAALLRSAGFTVVLSRTANSLVGRLGAQDFSGGLLSPQGVHDDVAARDECADLAHATLLVGIYFDACPSSQNAGCLTAYDHVRTFWKASLRLAQLVQGDVVSALNSHAWGVPDYGVTPDVGLGGPALDEAAADYGYLLLLGPAKPGWFSTPSEMPGALIEPLFVTDPFEASIAASAAGQRAIAGGIALAVEQYFAPAAAHPAVRRRTD